MLSYNSQQSHNNICITCWGRFCSKSGHFVWPIPNPLSAHFHRSMAAYPPSTGPLINVLSHHTRPPWWATKRTERFNKPRFLAMFVVAKKSFTHHCSFLLSVVRSIGGRRMWTKHLLFMRIILQAVATRVGSAFRTRVYVDSRSGVRFIYGRPKDNTYSWNKTQYFQITL